ncbi:hypothetical protein ACYOEI_14540 [Singulisphaera rosea]
MIPVLIAKFLGRQGRLPMTWYFTTIPVVKSLDVEEPQKVRGSGRRPVST